MAEFPVVGFDKEDDADRVLTELNRLQSEYLIDLEDAVIAIRDPQGKVRIKQSVSLTSYGAATGGLRGAMWGTLIGLLFSIHWLALRSAEPLALAPVRWPAI